MKTRRATIEDVKPVAELFSLYRIFYSQGQDVVGAEKFIFERLNNNESVIFVVEDDSNTIIGFAQLYPTFSSVAMMPLWILNDLYVDKAHRGKNAAGFLLDECAAFAKSKGARGLTLKTAHDNHVAQKLYERKGWTKDNQYISYFFRV